MHPTPLQLEFHVRCAGARVMPGVRRFLLARNENWFKRSEDRAEKLTLCGANI